MHVRRYLLLAVAMAISLLITGCNDDRQPDTDLISTAVAETLIAQAVQATQVQMADTATSTPTATLTPTATSIPATDTPVPAPTATAPPRPTDTPAPSLIDLVPPRGQYDHRYEVTEEYDDFYKNTSVSLDPVSSEMTANGHGSLWVLYTYPGREPAIPPSVILTIWVVNDSWEYLDCHSLAFQLDGETVISVETDFDGDVEDGYVIERIIGVLEIDEFLSLVDASRVRGRLCGTDFELTAEQMEALRDTASRMRPFDQSSSRNGAASDLARRLIVLTQRPANLRHGPGTNFGIAGNIGTGERLEVLGRNEAGDWLHVDFGDGQGWIAKFLVENVDTTDVPMDHSEAPTVTPLPRIALGTEGVDGGWRTRVTSVHRHSTLAIGNDFNAEHGNFLVVVMDVTNTQSHDDFYDLGGMPTVIDSSGRQYEPGYFASENAEWRYCPRTITREAEPNEAICVAFAYDIPNGAGDVYLRTKAGGRFALANFDAILVE